MHHIVSDGWSMRRARSRRSARCTPRARAADARAAAAAAHPVRGLRGLAARAALGRRRSTAARLLARATGRGAALDLPGRPTAPVAARRHRAARFAFRGRPSCSASAALAGAAGATPFMVLLAAFEALLHALHRPGRHRRRCADRRPEAGRSIERLIGCFVNILVMRTDSPATRRCASCSAACARSRSGAYAHQDLPVEMLLDEIQPRRTAAPRCPRWLGWASGIDPAPDTALAAPGLRLAPLEMDRGRRRWTCSSRSGIGAAGSTGSSSTARSCSMPRRSPGCSRVWKRCSSARSPIRTSAVGALARGRPARRRLGAAGVGSARADAAPEDLTDLTRGQLSSGRGRRWSRSCPSSASR